MGASLELSSAPRNYALRVGPEHVSYLSADPYLYSGMVAVWPDEHRAEIKALSSSADGPEGCELGPEIRTELRAIGVRHVRFERAEAGCLREINIDI